MSETKKKLYLAIDVEGFGPNCFLHHVFSVGLCIFDESGKLLDVYGKRVAKGRPRRSDKKYEYTDGEHKDTMNFLQRVMKDSLDDTEKTGIPPEKAGHEIADFIKNAMTEHKVNEFVILTDTTGYDEARVDKLLTLVELPEQEVLSLHGFVEGTHMDSIDVHSMYKKIVFERDLTELKAVINKFKADPFSKRVDKNSNLTTALEKHNPIMDAYCIGKTFFEKKEEEESSASKKTMMQRPPGLQFLLDRSTEF